MAGYKSALTVQERFQLIELVEHLRGVGLVGWLETRNLLASLFPEFADIRDGDIDSLILDDDSEDSEQLGQTELFIANDPGEDY